MNIKNAAIENMLRRLPLSHPACQEMLTEELQKVDVKCNLCHLAETYPNQAPPNLQQPTKQEIEESIYHKIDYANLREIMKRLGVTMGRGHEATIDKILAERQKYAKLEEEVTMHLEEAIANAQALNGNLEEAIANAQALNGNLTTDLER